MIYEYRNTRGKTLKIFNPDKIKTMICQALDRDLRTASQEHGRKHDSVVLLTERLRAEYSKKYSSLLSNQDALVELTYSKFENVNEHMAKYRKDLTFPDLAVRPQSKYSDQDNILIRARALMHFVLTPFLDDEWFQYCKHGTGTSLGVSSTDTSLEAKSKFPISLTRRVEPLMESYLLFDSQLNSALLYFNEHNPIGLRYEIVNGSRAATVEKNDQIRRMIAIEPTGNMFFQQGLMSMMYDRMRHVGLNVELLPQRHKRRALISSITSREATIDWSSASDCVSIELLRWLLPPKWFECCDMVRSPTINIDGDTVDLNMFSTMGNAVTFPLETLVFWTMAHATRLTNGSTLATLPEWRDLDKCSVFGDDCILPSTDAPLFIEAMTKVGFIINEEKSFFDDKGFRESCGGDYLRGYDVRPCHIKAPTSIKASALEPWLYIIANSLTLKYISCFGSLNYIYDKELFRVIAKIFCDAGIVVKLVPPHYPDDSGLKMSFDIQRFNLHYPGVTYSQVSKNKHGSYRFLFCNFRYRDKRLERFDDLHYCSWLKSPGGRRSPMWITRRNGGYVVAKGTSVHWTFDGLN